MTRDSIIDPQPGDVLRVKGSQITMVVKARRDRIYTAKLGTVKNPVDTVYLRVLDAKGEFLDDTHRSVRNLPKEFEP